MAETFQGDSDMNNDITSALKNANISLGQVEALRDLGLATDAGDLIYVAEMVLGGHAADAHWVARAAEMIAAAGIKEASPAARFVDAIERLDINTAIAALDNGDVSVSYDWAEAHEAALAALPSPSTEDTAVVVFSARGWLRVDDSDDERTVVDSRGGRWWPSEEAAAEIAAAADPAEAALEMCFTAPARGTWHS